LFSRHQSDEICGGFFRENAAAHRKPSQPSVLFGVFIQIAPNTGDGHCVRTRVPDVTQNAAILLALMWYYAGNGKGDKNMVKMESLGKERDLDGNIVRQGIAVYGNKGSTDQHAYVQQLRDGALNFS